MMPSSDHKRSAIRSYKKASAGLFEGILGPRDLKEADVYRYLGLYARFERCAKLRKDYRDTFVPKSQQDDGHEKAIHAASQRAGECEHILQGIFHQAGLTKCHTLSSETEGDEGNESRVIPAAVFKKTDPRRGSRRRGKEKVLVEGSRWVSEKETMSFLLQTKLQDMSNLVGVLLRKVATVCEERRLSFGQKEQLEIAVEFTILCYKLRGTRSASRLQLHNSLLNFPLPVPLLLELGLRVVRDGLPFHRMTDTLTSLITDFETADAAAEYRLKFIVMLLAADSIVQTSPKNGVLFTYILRSLRALEAPGLVNVRTTLHDMVGISKGDLDCITPPTSY